MGGGLTFLNKKSWHTGGMKQMEAVWKREQEHAKEQKKVAELQKQIQEEREQQDLQRLHESGSSSSRKPKSEERLEFMYNTPLANRAALEKDDQQAFLLGEKKVDLSAKESADTKVSQCERVTQQLMPSAYTEDTPQSRNEVWARMQNDPLFAIKRQQQQQLARIKKNPVQMQAIRNQVKEAKAKQLEEEEAEYGKEGSKRSRRHHHRSSSSSSRRHRHRSSGHRDHKEGKELSSQNERQSVIHHRSHHKRSHSHHRSRSRSRSRSPTHTGRHRRSKHREGKRHNSDRQEGELRRDRGSGGERDGYGLDISEAGITGTNQHQKGKFNARERIREAEREQEEERRERERRNKAWSYGGKGKHKVGRMNEQEKQRRLEEMMSNAQDHSQSRLKEIKRREDEQDQIDRQGTVSNKSGKETFLDTFQKNLYGASAQQEGSQQDVSLQDAIGRRKFYSERRL